MKTTTCVPLFRLSARSVNSIRMLNKDYQHPKLGPFVQAAPVLENPFTSDPILPRALKRLLPNSEYNSVATDLSNFGQRIVKEVDALGLLAERDPPRLEQFDAWGNRVDNLIVTPAWDKLKGIAAEEGLIAIGYDKSRSAEARRIHQFAKLYLFHPSSGLVTCPLAMTDGAAKTISELNLGDKFPDLKEAYNRLTSRDPKHAWTSGQWMTEKAGGSDVGGGCDTYAVPVDEVNHKLSGYKWFSSAIDADMTLTLARTVQDGKAVSGSRGLSLFFLRLRDQATGKLNGIQMLKLKNKLGTKQLPTAELLLDGVNALKVSAEGRGVPSIANMLNITRVHNAVASASSIRRVVSLARDWSTRRVAFGNKLVDWPLHLATLANLEILARGTLLFTLESARLLGRFESGEASAEEIALLRLITPILKLHTGKVCVPAISEGIECFGGQGYIEDTGIPGIMRDAQVTAIWEGTTNVLSLDILRVFKTTKFAAFEAFVNRISGIVTKAKSGQNEKVVQAGTSLEKAFTQLVSTLKAAQKDPQFPANLQRGARDIGISMGNVYTGALLVEFAAHAEATPVDADVASRYCVEQQLLTVSAASFDATRNDVEKNIIFENYGKSKL
uniref:Acyl-CoA dehydrogenase n=1 Tax=Panagrellus redivivus TaxID=6233 RepID=A0A7E4ZPX0_PANRE